MFEPCPSGLLPSASSWAQSVAAGARSCSSSRSPGSRRCCTSPTPSSRPRASARPSPATHAILTVLEAGESGFPRFLLTETVFHALKPLFHALFAYVSNFGVKTLSGTLLGPAFKACNRVTGLGADSAALTSTGVGSVKLLATMLTVASTGSERIEIIANLISDSYRPAGSNVFNTTSSPIGTQSPIIDGNFFKGLGVQTCSDDLDGEEVFN